MAYERQYTQGVGWENEPSLNTPISAENLNQMDNAIKDVDEAAYNEFLAVYAAIAQAGGGNAVNFYIDSASNNTLSSQTSVLSDVTLKANDLIFLYMSVDGTYTSPTGGWGVTYSMYVDDTLTSFTATIVDYLHGEGAMWHEGFSANLVQGTWLILRVVSTTVFDCIGRINPASGGGSSTLAGLTDTNITNPVDGQALKYNNTAGKWENASGNNYSDIITSGTQQLLMVSEESDIFYDGLMTPGNMLFLRASVDCEFESGAYPSFNGWLLAWEGESGSLMGSPIYDRRDAAQGPIPFAEDISADTLLVFTISNNNYISLVALIPAGGGGTTVIANPSDPASSDLEKLQVGNTIYAINAGNSAEGNKITSTLHTDPDKLVTNIQLDSGIAEHEGDVFYLTSELDTGTSSTGWNVKLQYAVSGGGYADTYVPLFGMNPSTVMDMFSGDITAGDILVVKVTHSGIVQSYAMYILAYISASGGGASTLAGLTDTNIVSPTAAQPLTYDATNSKWINGGIIPYANGGTGNNTGYVQAGRKANTTIGGEATAEGTRNTASGNQSHAEGVDTTASNTAAHAEGSNTQATGLSSHAEGGGGVIASGSSSHAEGASTTASGNYSHAEGQGAKAQALATHAQNCYTTASANYSSAAGYYTTAGYQNQFVVGKYNDNKSTSIFEVGIGTANNAKANGLELDTSGNLKTAGTITNGKGVTVGDADVLLPATVGWTGKNLLNEIHLGNINSAGAYDDSSTNRCTNATSATSSAILLKAGSYILSATGLDSATVITKNAGGSIVDNYASAWHDLPFTFTATDNTYFYFTGRKNDNTDITLSNVTAMLRDARITDPTYEPYHKSVEECLEDINDKLSYLEQTVTLSTSASTTVTFTDSSITANSFIEYACSQWDLVPESITGAAGSCTIVLPKVDSAQSVTVRIYVR